MTRFLIIRHGQTTWNTEHRVQGLTDIPLNEIGLSQAQQLAHRLKEEVIHYAYTSHLSRAKQTAQLALRFHPGVHLEELPDLAEFGLGAVEGLTIDEAHARHTPAFWDDDEMRAQLGMELKRDYLTRFRQHIPQWLQKHHNQTVLLSSHGGKLRTLIDSFALPLADQAIVKSKYCGNCSLTIIEAEGNHHRLALYACDRHLIERME